MYKLIVSGFDGVLIDSDEAINMGTVMKIDNLRRNGEKFCVFTDRVLQDILDYNRDFPFIDYIIACSGTCLYDVNKEQIILKKCLPINILKIIEKNFIDYDIYVSTSDKRFLFEDTLNTNIYKIEIECSKKKIALEIEKKLKSLNLDIKFWSQRKNTGYVVSIIAKDFDKGILLKEICSLEKINLNEVIGIGGDIQDMSIIKLVGMKVVVSNGPSSLKKVADIITDSNNNKGVEKVLEQLF
ncbi:MAG: HAD hydrolase family protein [bacterium]|nr:HAD hydrolase family protein [bacterium]